MQRFLLSAKLLYCAGHIVIMTLSTEGVAANHRAAVLEEDEESLYEKVDMEHVKKLMLQ